SKPGCIPLYSANRCRPCRCGSLTTWLCLSTSKRATRRRVASSALSNPAETDCAEAQPKTRLGENHAAALAGPRQRQTGDRRHEDAGGLFGTGKAARGE